MLRLIVAQSSQQVADAKQVRWQVYREEEGMLPGEAMRRELEVEAGARDGSGEGGAEVADLVVYSGWQPVGALRLQVGRVASASSLGLELEEKFALSGFSEPRTRAAEVTRFCVLRAFRGTRAAALLFGGLRRESVLRGVTHWLAAANMETDSGEDAEIAYRLIQEKELVSRHFQARAREPALPVRGARRFVYTSEQRRQAQSGRLADLKLPRVLALFANKMGARYIGAPAYDAYFNVFALPLAVRLADLA